MAILRLKVNVYGMKGKLTLEKEFPLLYIIQDLRNFDHSPRCEMKAPVKNTSGSSPNHRRCEMKAPVKNTSGSRAQTHSLCYKRATCVSPNHSPRCEMKAPVKNTSGSRAQTHSLCYKRATCVSPNHSPRCEMKAPVKNTSGSRATHSATKERHA